MNIENELFIKFRTITNKLTLNYKINKDCEIINDLWNFFFLAIGTENTLLKANEKINELTTELKNLISDKNELTKRNNELTKQIKELTFNNNELTKKKSHRKRKTENQLLLTGYI